MVENQPQHQRKNVRIALSVRAAPCGHSRTERGQIGKRVDWYYNRSNVGEEDDGGCGQAMKCDAAQDGLWQLVGLEFAYAREQFPDLCRHLEECAPCRASLAEITAVEQEEADGLYGARVLADQVPPIPAEAIRIRCAGGRTFFAKTSDIPHGQGTPRLIVREVAGGGLTLELSADDCRPGRTTLVVSMPTVGDGPVTLCLSNALVRKSLVLSPAPTFVSGHFSGIGDGIYWLLVEVHGTRVHAVAIDIHTTAERRLSP